MYLKTRKMLLEEHTDDSVILKLVSRLIVMKLLLNPNQPTYGCASRE